MDKDKLVVNTNSEPMLIDREFYDNLRATIEYTKQMRDVAHEKFIEAQNRLRDIQEQYKQKEKIYSDASKALSKLTSLAELSSFLIRPRDAVTYNPKDSVDEFNHKLSSQPCSPIMAQPVVRVRVSDKDEFLSRFEYDIQSKSRGYYVMGTPVVFVDDYIIDNEVEV